MKSFTRVDLRQNLQKWTGGAFGICLQDLDRADEALAKTRLAVPTSQIVRNSRKLAHLQREKQRYRSLDQRVDETGETQVSLSDPE